MAQDNENGQTVHIHIDHRAYVSSSPTTGAALYRIANIPAGAELFKDGNGHDSDSSIADDSGPVQLKNGDRFHTGRPATHGVEIFVNTESFIWERPQISYDEVVKLAYPAGPFDGSVRYSITWSRPDGQEGALLSGNHVRVVKGMQFDVRNTDKS